MLVKWMRWTRASSGSPSPSARNENAIADSVWRSASTGIVFSKTSPTASRRLPVCHIPDTRSVTCSMTSSRTSPVAAAPARIPDRRSHPRAVRPAGRRSRPDDGHVGADGRLDHLSDRGLPDLVQLYGRPEQGQRLTDRRRGLTVLAVWSGDARIPGPATMAVAVGARRGPRRGRAWRGAVLVRLRAELAATAS